MTTTEVKFIDNSAAKSGFVSITINSDKVLKSWKKSIYSYEWLNQDGHIKPLNALTNNEQQKRKITENNIAAGKHIAKPILGIGIMDNIEIGTGRSDLLTLIDQGHKTIPVHVPKGQQGDFTAFIATEETGNVLFYILIAIGLLAALSYTVATTSQSTVSGLSSERANLLATEILSTANTVAEATAKLRLNECLEDQISFETSKLTGHTNASAPSDDSCHIFKLNGGGLVYQPLNAEAAATNLTAIWQYTGDLEINYISTTCAGNSCAELLILAKNIDRQVCEQLNELSSVRGSTPTITLTAPTDFEGSYDYVDTIGDQASHEIFSGKRSGCFQNTVDSAYIFFRTLLQR